MNPSHEQLLYGLCKAVHEAHLTAERDYREERGIGGTIELFVYREDRIAIEIRAEDVSHNEPHLHITHSDKIDVSLSLIDFRPLAGKIDRKTMKKLRPALERNQIGLRGVWDALNETGESLKAHRIISNLEF